jgi:hypothetical protein
MRVNLRPLRRPCIGVVVSVAVLAVGCGQDSPSAPGSSPGRYTTTSVVTVPEPVDARCPARAAWDAGALVGLSEGDATRSAREHGCSLRVVERDGEAYSVTADVQDDRVNVAVEDGTVTRVDRIG